MAQQMCDTMLCVAGTLAMYMYMEVQKRHVGCVFSEHF